MQITDIKDLTVKYEMYVYLDDEFKGSFSTEYPKELKQHLKQSKFLAEKLNINETYRFFKRVFKVLNNKEHSIINECYEITEAEII